MHKVDPAATAPLPSASMSTVRDALRQPPAGVTGALNASAQNVRDLIGISAKPTLEIRSTGHWTHD